MSVVFIDGLWSIIRYVKDPESLSWFPRPVIGRKFFEFETFFCLYLFMFVVLYHNFFFWDLHVFLPFLT